jgi:hypothetical protein
MNIIGEDDCLEEMFCQACDFKQMWIQQIHERNLVCITCH